MKCNSLRPEHLQRLLEVKMANGYVIDSLPESASPVPASNSIVCQGNGQNDPQETFVGSGTHQGSNVSPHSNCGKDYKHILRASDIEPLFEFEFGDYCNQLQVFLLLAHAFTAGATSYRQASVMLKDPFSPLLAGELISRIVSHIRESQHSFPYPSAFTRAVGELEGKLGTDLVDSQGEGFSRNCLTDAGKHLAELTEFFWRKCCKT